MASNPFQSARESLVSLFDENRKKVHQQFVSHLWPASVWITFVYFFFSMNNRNVNVVKPKGPAAIVAKKQLHPCRPSATLLPKSIVWNWDEKFGFIRWMVDVPVGPPAPAPTVPPIPIVRTATMKSWLNCPASRCVCICLMCFLSFYTLFRDDGYYAIDVKLLKRKEKKPNRRY